MEGREDEAHLDVLGRKMVNDWDSQRKLVQAVLTEGSSDSTVARLEYAQSILGRILNNNLHVAHVRDRDLLTDEGVAFLDSGARKKGLLLFIGERRNREAFLVEPSVVERVVHARYLDKMPVELQKDGGIASHVQALILAWCKEELDQLPVKVREYNLGWMRKPVGNFVRRHVPAIGPTRRCSRRPEAGRC